MKQIRIIIYIFFNRYTDEDQKAQLYNHMNVCTYDTPELFASDEEWKVRNNVYKRV